MNDTTQGDLFDLTLEGRRDGETFDPYQDESRLNKQMRRTWLVMRDQQWHTLSEVAALTNDPEASISARLRDFRKERFGGLTLERRRASERGLWEYRLLPAEQYRRMGRGA